MSKETLRLKRHETFSIREGWLEKGINRLNNDPHCMRKDEGTRSLGLGSNMVKSLRYWLTATKLVTFNSQSGGTLTELGKFVLEYDPFLENKTSLWLIHYNLVTNFDDSPIFNAFFNMKQNKIEKESLVTYLKEYFEPNYSLGAISSLESDVSVLLKSYCYTPTDDPENNMNCPLGKLGLLKQVERNLYSKTQPMYDELDSRVIYVAIMDYCNKNNINDSFNLEDYLDSKDNVMQIFNINKSSLNMYLDELKKQGLLSLIKTAGLNTVYINKKLDLKDLFLS